MRRFIIFLFVLSWSQLHAQGVDTLINVNSKFYIGFQQAIIDELFLMDSVSRALIDENGTLLAKFNVNRLGVTDIEFLSDGPNFIQTAVRKTLQNYTAIELTSFYKYGGKAVFILPIKFYYRGPYKQRKLADILKTLPDLSVPIKKRNPDYFERMNKNKDDKLAHLVYLLTPLILQQRFVEGFQNKD